ncbi:MAG: RnfABCDGE type electron transport complex subunit D [Candidatus Omnitrophica bacterium]|nr:RnfABCDGE type electron transport complex subunit D [Candidatus Omnitrophota bacterium]
MSDFKSIKTQLIIFLIIFAIFMGVRDKDTIFLLNSLISAFFALMLEGVILYFKSKTFSLKDSAIITGIIIAYVLSSDCGIGKLLLADTLAIGSKYLIRFKNRHIFNPAAFGIFIPIFFLNTYTHWKGTYLAYIIVFVGIYFAYRLKKIEIIISYIISSSLLFYGKTFLQNKELWNIFGYFNYFYIFIMVIEPKTTPLSIIGKYIFGAGLAIFIFIFTELGVKFDVEVFSLLVMNLTVPILNRVALKGGNL